MRKLIHKGDIALLILFAAAAVLIACIPAMRSSSGNRTAHSGSSIAAGGTSSQASGVSGGNSPADPQVVITVAGQPCGTYPLSENQVIEISNSYGTNEVTIRDGGVSVTKSDCANQICVDTGVIRSEGQMIICLPHRLAIEITAPEKQEEEYDAIVR